MKMEKIPQNKNICTLDSFDISDEDILEAMRGIGGYLDITPGDFKLLYHSAYKHAIKRLTRLIKARDVMTQDVIFVNHDSPLEEVASVMAAHSITGIPVIDHKEKVVGVISEKDFLFHMGGKDTSSFMGLVSNCLSNKGCIAISMRQQKADEIMTSPAITVPENLPVSDIADILTKKNINRVPVTDQNGKLLGIVARADIVQSSCYPDINERV